MPTPTTIPTTATHPSDIYRAIERAFHDAEEVNNHQVDDLSIAIVVTYWEKLVRHAATKFVKGDKEHNPTNDPRQHFLLVDGVAEARNEVVDGIAYNAVEDWKRTHPGCVARYLQSIANQAHQP